MLLFILKALVRAAERRRLSAEVHQLSDATLKDIGLTRHGLRRGASEPATSTEMPSAHLPHRSMSRATLKLVARALVAGSLVVSPGQSRAEAFLAWFDQNAAADRAVATAFCGGGHWHACGTHPTRTPPRERVERGEPPLFDDQGTSPAPGSGGPTGRAPAPGGPVRERTSR